MFCKVLLLCVVVLSPVVLGLFVAIHLKVADKFAVSGILTIPPLHIAALLALVIDGAGFTVTVTD